MVERSSPIVPHQSTPAELKQRVAAERAGEPFLLFRDGEACQRIVALVDSPVLVGREPECGVCLGWDSRVSRVHAELSHVGGHWVVDDNGLSRNGTFLNGERVRGRRRLRDRDQLEVGATLLVFRDPARARSVSTEIAASDVAMPFVSEAQRRVLVALCRPFGDDSSFARAATNQEIADALHLSLPAVKMHLRTLFQRFGLSELPQNEKRAALAHAALNGGVVSPAELEQTRSS